MGEKMKMIVLHITYFFSITALKLIRAIYYFNTIPLHVRLIWVFGWILVITVFCLSIAYLYQSLRGY